MPAVNATDPIDLLAAAPGFGFTAGQPIRDRPADPVSGPGCWAGSTVAAVVVLPTTQLHWYEPARNKIRTGSMGMFGNWASDRAGDGAGPDDIWYIVLTPAV